MKVLLIEPDKILAAAALEALEAAAHTVRLCRTAQDALDALDIDTPDIIVLELQLGIHNGIEFLYEIRSYLEWQNIPVIVHTLNAHVADERFADSFAQLGVQMLLYKPHTSSRQLVRAVGKFVPL